MQTIDELRTAHKNKLDEATAIQREIVRLMLADSAQQKLEYLRSFTPGEKIRITWDDDYTGPQEDTGAFIRIEESWYANADGVTGVPGPKGVYFSDRLGHETHDSGCTLHHV